MPRPPAILQSLSAALRLAAEQNEQQQAQLAIAGPKASALDRLATANGSLTNREAAKDVQFKPLVFSNWLREHRWIFKQGRTNLAYQTHLDAKLIAHKVRLVEVNGKDGVTFEKEITKGRIIPRGLGRWCLAR